MKKSLAVVSIICLAGCEKPLPEAPFGLNWSMTKEEAVKLAPEKPRVKKIPDRKYEIKVPKPDSDNGLYLAMFNQDKFSGITVNYMDFFNQKDKAEKMFDYYDSLLSTKYGNKKELPVLPNQKKLCLEREACVIRAFQYGTDHFLAAVSLIQLGEFSHTISVTYGEREFLEKLRESSMEQ